MNKLYKYIFPLLFSFFFFIPLSVSAEMNTTFPDWVTDEMKDQLYIYLGNTDSFNDLVVYFDNSSSLAFVSMSVSDFNYESGSMVLSNLISIDSSGSISQLNSSYSVSNFRTDSNRFFYMKNDGSYYFGRSFYAEYPEGFMLNVTQYLSDVQRVYDFESYPTSFDVTVSSGSFSFRGDLTCTSEVNGTCSIYSSDVDGPLSDPLEFYVDESPLIYGDISNSNSKLDYYEYNVNTVIEILFDDYYTGYFTGNFEGFTSDNAIVGIGSRLYFTDTNKITLSSISHHSSINLIIPSFNFAFTGYDFGLSSGRSVKDTISHTLLTTINSSIKTMTQSLSDSIRSLSNAITGRPADTGATQPLVNSSNELSNLSDNLHEFESSFNSDLTSNLSDINISSGNLSNVSDFVSTANFVKVQFDSVLDNSGIFKTAITFSLIIGLALLLIGRRS